ncbi:MAG: 23S rRNA (uracil(1939)-C(5))-methyltransferase RlmD [Gammaproteobacteria bacterium]
MGKRRAAPAEPFIVRIDSLSHEGRGVARRDGKTVFIDNALSGEEVRARLTRRHRRYDEAIAVEVLTSSPLRVPAGCAHFGVCGGCSLQHLSPLAQIEHKQRMLLEQLQHIGKVQPHAVLPPLTGPVWGYRRRARLGLRLVPKKGGVLVGFREKNSHFIADIDSCPVLDPAIGERLKTIRSIVGALSCPDQIPQIEVGVDDIGPVLTLRHLRPLTANDLEILTSAAADHGWRFYLQPGGTDSVHPVTPGQRTPSFSVPRHNIALAFEPLDFIQVNAAINLDAIDKVIELLALNTHDRVLDLFCGLGNFSIPIARYVAQVVGVEGDAGLVVRASANANRNGLTNAQFFKADLTKETPPISDFNKLLLDPPRTGAIEVLRTLNLGAVDRIVYVSCNPATLARDAEVIINQHGFQLQCVGIMDMFPHTAHVESIALFVR